ncbi:MAG: hypothetical protein ABIH23_24170, partial [bacterium]
MPDRKRGAMLEGDKRTLHRVIGAAQRRVFLLTAASALVRSSVMILPPAALAIAAYQRWGNGQWISAAGWASISAILILSFVIALVRFHSRLGSALAVDQEAHLKDRISSAYEFLAQKELHGPHKVQIADAVRHAHQIRVRSLFRFQPPKYTFCFPVAVLLFTASFFTPPVIEPEDAEAAFTAVKDLQLDELRALQEELSDEEETSEELQAVFKKLEEIEKRFEEGLMSERELMITLSRLDEVLRQNAAALGVENLEEEMEIVTPYFLSAPASEDLGAALAEGQFDKANQELDKLAEKVEKEELSPAEKKDLALKMGVAASKLNKNAKTATSSFSGDLSQASGALL